MNAWEIIGLIFLVLVVALIAVNMRDIIRYVKIRMM
jgi:hypothetical protein